jgi:hypothetical protein
MPLFLPKKPGDSALTTRSDERLREMKLRIASLEMLLSEGQKDRLCSVVRLLENAESSSVTVEILEKLAKDLEFALS